MADDAKLRDYLRRATVDLRKANRRLRDLEERQHEPVAIIGMSCRYPGGVSTPEELWDLIVAGGDGISGFPTDRGWDLEGLYDPDPDHSGTTYVREGGFLYNAGEFDAEFFRIGPREALAMDPQQRLLLETSWEALEDAGIDPVSLRGSQTGVFTGLMYYYGSSGQSVPADLEGYLETGAASSVASGRVAYTLGLEGPAVTLDTACSSSLVALHLACGALRGGECSLALAGGATVMAVPDTFVGFSRQRGLAPDGRCKSFSDRADGVGWSEGAGVLLLERLADAQRLGHPILAVVRGSAVNQDGASNGLTAPNGPSQQRVIAQALANAGLSAGDVDAVEAHGTGTTLGDPIEAQALLATYGQGRPDDCPLWLGSIKSNIGHTQAAAGVAGVIKMVMAMRHGVLPKTLHVDEPSRQVDWSAGRVSLLVEEMPWLDGVRPRRAAVSSFGISGTNAHVVLEEPDISVAGVEENGGGGSSIDGPADVTADVIGGESADGEGPKVGLDGVVPWLVSGRGVGGLRGQAGRLLGFVEGDGGLDVLDVGFSLAAGRSVFEHRAVVLGGGSGELLAGLGALVEGRPSVGVVEGVARGVGRGSVFVFPGQGSQWVGMAVGLLDSSPVFAERLGECGEALSLCVDWSLEGVLRGVGGEPGLDRVDVVQPVLWAVMVSLAGLWRACGVEPGVVVGHSQGEIAAVCVAGGLSLWDAARLVVLRSGLLVGLMGRGGMVSVAAGVGEVEGWLDGWEGVSVAAVNGPGSVVVSGERDALDGLLSELVGRGVRAREIPVGYASHSAQIEGIRGELLEACVSIVPRSGDVPFYSTVVGGLVDMAGLDAEYWYRNLRETVQFEGAVRGLLGDGYRAFVEVSPHPVLTVGIQETVDHALGDSDEIVIGGTLRREHGGLDRFFASLAEVWVRGVDVDWAGLFGGSGAEHVGLPFYAFQRERFWLTSRTGGVGDVAAAGLMSAGHPFLSAMVELGDGEGWVFTGRLGLDTHPWLGEHAVSGVALLPGTAFLELALCAGGEVGCDVVEELVLEAPLALVDGVGVQVQVSVGGLDEAGRRSINIYSRLESATGDGVLKDQRVWVHNAGGALVEGGDAGERTALVDVGVERLVGVWPPQGTEAVGLDDLYDRLAGLGLEYGAMFQGLCGVWRRGDEVFAEVALPESQRGEAGEFGVHPALLDAALHAVGMGVLDADGPDADGNGDACVRLPFSWGGARLFGAGASSLRVRLCGVEDGGVSLVAVDERGGLVASVESLLTREVSRDALRAAGAVDGAGGLDGSLFRVDWTAAPVGAFSAVDAGGWAVLVDEGVAGGDAAVNEEGVDGDGVESSPPPSDGRRDRPRGSGLAGVLGGVGAGVGVFRGLGSLGEVVDGGGVVPGVVFVDCTLGGFAGEDLDGVGPPGEGGDGVVDGGDGVVGGVVGVAHGVVRGVLGLLQGWLVDERFVGSRLVFVTRGAVGVEGEGVAGLVCAGVWGLVRSAQSENPGRFVLLDLEDEGLGDVGVGGEGVVGAGGMVGLLGGVLGLDESQLVVRGGRVLVPRLVRVPAAAVVGGSAAAGDGLVARSVAAEGVVVGSGLGSGSVLVTGGTGGLGALVARHLVLGGVGCVVLVSRRGGGAEGAGELRVELEGLGARVEIVACDVGDRVQLEGVLEGIPGEFPLRMVVHAAGVLDDGVIGSLTGERVDGVLAPKVDGAWYLHELTEGLGLQEFVLFSSAAGTFGTPGQGNYAAGNAFLDALAVYRRAKGLPGVSLAWGLWEQETGLTGELSDVDRRRMTRQGVRGFSPEEGLALFDTARSGEVATVVPTHLDLATLRAQARTGMVPALLRNLIRTPTRRASEATGDLARRLVGVASGDRRRLVLGEVCAHVAAVLGHASSEAVDERRAFKDLGFDSLAAVELRNRLVAVTGLQLPATLVFDYPTSVAVADFLLGELAGSGSVVRAVSVVSVDEPVAIVGMSCRYPGGVRTPGELWDLVVGGGDAISGFPTDRGWDLEGLFDADPERQGTSYVREGGFLYDAGEFDPGFFGIGPREALAMDPQQRLLLEASWEACEDAGIDPVSLRGSQTGVFAGVMFQGYGIGGGSISKELEAYIGMGTAGSVLSGRVAYTFGFEGPAVTVDTACSSSLVALHLACGALRGGECSLALAGGVTVLATPGVFVEFSLQRGLALDGRCKPFADAADGTALSEGVGVLLLERLSDARRLGHPVLGLVRGSAVNQDGASNGLTAPNGPSQQRVIAQALASAGLSAEQVDMVEAHGTGTMLGDPIEAQALLATYGQRRSKDRPLRLGSIKSNIGHTQAAAGVAGVIKVVMAMRHGLLPKSLHIDEPSQKVDWSTGAVALLTETTPWPASPEPRRAAISSFGISGTNAHAIIEEPPVIDLQDAADCPSEGVSGHGGISGVDADNGGTVPAGNVMAAVEDGRVVPWVLSGRDAGGLRSQASRLVEFVGGDPGLDISDLGLSLVGRSAFEHRALVLGGDREALVRGVSALASGSSMANLVSGVASADAGQRVVFVFPGQGSQWVGMAVGLLDSSPVFAGWVGLCGGALAPFVDWSLEGVLRGVEGSPGLDRVDVVQPVLWAVMVSLAGLWRACGVEPDVVVGHSQGEIAAACVAGGLSLDDGARLVALRSRALVGLMGCGGMVSVAAGVGEVEGWLDGWEGVSVAAVNGPGSVVVSGERGALDGLLLELVGRGVRAREIPVGYASHSVQVEGIRGELLDAFEGVVPCSGGVPFFSTVSGGLVDTGELDGEYWYRNLRERVRFGEATRSLVADGYRVFVEVGPHPVLTVGVQETVDGMVGELGDVRVGDVLVAGSLRRGQGGLDRFLVSLGEVWVHGVGVDWARVFAGSGAARVELPTYAFQRERFWLESGSVGVGDVGRVGQVKVGHPLLGAMIELMDGEGWVFTGRVGLDKHPWFADHAVSGVVLLPGTAFLELVLCAAGEVGCDVVEELVLEMPLALVEGVGVQVQVVVGGLDEHERRRVSVYSRHERILGSELLKGENAWVRNASGVLADGGGMSAAEMESVEEELGLWPPAGAEALEIDGLYDGLAGLGLEYGVVFQGLRGVWRRGEEMFAEVTLPEGQRDEGGEFGVHPVLLDAALHAVCMRLLEAGTDLSGGGGVRLPFSWGGVRLFASGASSLRVRLRTVGDGGVSLLALDETGGLVASVESLLTREISEEALRAASTEVDGAGVLGESLFCVDWTAVPAGLLSGAEAGGWAVLADTGVGGVVGGSELADVFGEAGIDVALYRDLGSFGEAVDGDDIPRVVFVDCSADRVVEVGLDGLGEGGVDAVDEGPDGRVVEVAHEAVRGVLGLLQAWLVDERFAFSRLVCVTRGAVGLDGGDVSGLACAAVWGLVRSAQSENPGRFVLLDVEGGDLRDAGAVGNGGVVGLLGGALALDEPQFAVREGRVLVPRLVRVPATVQGDRSAGYMPVVGGALRGGETSGSVLITGGTGGLGALVARHLVGACGVRCVVLASRRGREAAGAVELEDELVGLGAQVVVATCDVSDRDGIEGLLGLVPEEFPLRMVVHAAGLLDDGVIGSLTAERVDGVMGAKADAAWYLHELTEDLGLEEFVLFSSAAGTFGASGQGNYAAANAFLDALAAYRRARGLPGLSLAWGLWEQATGLTGALSDADRRRMAHRGVSGFSPEEGLALLDVARSGDRASVVPTRLDITALRAQARAGTVPALLRDLIRVPTRRAQGEEGALARRVADTPREDRQRIIVREVRAHVAAVLGHASPEAVDVQRTFKDLGFDSLAAVELRNRLAAGSGLRLPATLVFDYPTSVGVADYLLEELTKDGKTTGRSAGGELDRLMDAVRSLAGTEDERVGITARLQALLQELDGIRQPEKGAMVAEKIEAASDDEIFEFIDAELGAL